jgi:hypothetical protein
LNEKYHDHDGTVFLVLFTVGDKSKLHERKEGMIISVENIK